MTDMTDWVLSEPRVFPCHAEPELFDSEMGPEHKDVRRAKKVCWTCPSQLNCLAQGREGREYGIWGGESQPERFSAIGFPEREDGLVEVPECGTETAYRRHIAIGEECPTDVCWPEHRKRQRVYDEARRERRRKEVAEENAAIEGTRLTPRHAPLRKTCSTPLGYRRHQRRGELNLIPHPECRCRETYAAERARQRDAAKKTEQVAA